MVTSNFDGTKHMIDHEMAERIRMIIKEKGGYDHFSQISDINRQTLIRIATAKSEPKISHIILIAQESGIDIKDIVYGKETNEFLQSLRNEEERGDLFSYVSTIQKKINKRMSELEHEYVELRRELENKEINIENLVQEEVQKLSLKNTNNL